MQKIENFIFDAVGGLVVVGGGGGEEGRRRRKVKSVIFAKDRDGYFI